MSTLSALHHRKTSPFDVHPGDPNVLKDRAQGLWDQVGKKVSSDGVVGVGHVVHRIINCLTVPVTPSLQLDLSDAMVELKEGSGQFLVLSSHHELEMRGFCTYL